jgi:hypothetical protein
MTAADRSDAPAQTALPAELEKALLRLDRAVAARLAAPGQTAPVQPDGVQAQELADLRARLSEREAEVARLTAALDAADRARAEALAKVDSAAEALDAVLAGSEG